ncbi:tetratricopeptide repeat protein [Bacteroidales bacterium OttesenSCG-928-M11]|nr:tetratricopeptide repeat protein [Bacteroidales bacterium OttesenSCG-928-M11]
MSKRFYLPLFLAVFSLAIMTGCSSKLQPLASEYITAEPQPLELVAGKVPVTIHATFPAGWFNKKATVTVIPVLRYEGGEAWGNSYVYQGEKVAGNGQVIPEKTGANATMYSSFDYVPEMLSSQLYLTFKAKIGNKEVELPDIKIGDGVLATAALLDASTENPAIAPDKFQRIIKEQYNEDIMFLIQQAELRSAELKKESLQDWKDIVENANQAPNQNVDIEISAYASPDGGLELNEKLAEKREKNTQSYISREMKKSKVDAEVNARYTAQDWEGFRELVEKSNIQDKDLILRVLSMYKDSEQREREIKNISSVFSVLADEVLPKLRRSRLTANIEIIGKSDEEILSIAATAPKNLKLEELLYAAYLSETTAEKTRIYTEATKYFPNDSRAYNNLGVIEYEKGNIQKAISFFNKANEKGTLAEANVNLGFAALAEGNKAKAEQYFGNASGVDELGAAMGHLAILEGRYNNAVTSFGNTVNNNAALAQILAKDYNKASKTLNEIANPNATTSYLKAIVGARTNNVDAVATNLKQAVTLDTTLATKAVQDVEFSKYITNKQFLDAILR